MKSWTWKDLALAVLGNLFTAALTFLLTSPSAVSWTWIRGSFCWRWQLSLWQVPP